MKHACFAQAHKVIQAKGFNILLGLKALFLLRQYLYPQALAVKAVLVAQLAPLHGAEALHGVFVRAAPPVVDAHRVIGRDRPIDKGPVGLAFVKLAHLLERAVFLPELEQLAFLRGEIYPIGNISKCHSTSCIVCHFL